MKEPKEKLDSQCLSTSCRGGKSSWRGGGHRNFPQVPQLVVDQSERLRKIKGNEKIYVDKAFNDNGVMKVEVVTALENRWLTDISPLFRRIVLNLEHELCPSVFVKDVLEGSCWSSVTRKRTWVWMNGERRAVNRVRGSNQGSGKKNLLDILKYYLYLLRMVPQYQ